MTVTENTNRIAKNTVLLYGRSLFNMVVLLYVTRLVRSILGDIDNGVYSAIGNLVAICSPLFSALSAAVSRYLTFEIEKGNREKLNRIFSTSLIIHAVLAVVILIVAETIGLWWLNAKMVIPDERMYAAKWVFHCAVFSLLLGVVSPSYTAAIVAHERMSAYAYIGVFEVVARLTVVLLLAFSPLGADKLIAFSILYACVGLLVTLLYMIYAAKHFSECRSISVLDRSLLREMTGFAGWNFFGSAANSLSTYGVNGILLNLFGGPIVNAARGYANSVGSSVNSLVANFTIAISPQITKSYAVGDRDLSMTLIQRGARFSFYALLIIVLPLLFETDFVLRLWLGEKLPEHTINFVRLVLMFCLCEIPFYTLNTLLLATGKIRNYQIVIAVLMSMNFVVSYIFLKMGYEPEVVMVIAIVISSCCLLTRLLFLRKLVQLSIKNYVFQVLGNLLLITVCAMILPSIVYYGFSFSSGVMQFVSVSFACVLWTSGVVFWLGCAQNERVFIRQKCVNMYNKLAKK